MRSKFDEQLAWLHQELIQMGGLCENAIGEATKALVNCDIAIAKRVPELSTEIDQKERGIEAMCMQLLLRQQPVATDLRSISSALKMVTDMERIGDNSGDIAEIVTMGHIQRIDSTLPLQTMAEATIKMVTDSINAFVGKNISLAKAVIDYDDVVDDYFNKIKISLIDQLKDPGVDGESALDLLMIAKYLERMGDHAVEIAKWVLFSLTGKKDERGLH